VGEPVETHADADPPPKEPGRHRWMATTAYTLTPSQAAAAAEGAQLTLEPSMMIAFAIGCIDCEQPYHPARLEPCPAGDDWSVLGEDAVDPAG
jgi:hypothetical protein